MSGTKPSPRPAFKVTSGLPIPAVLSQRRAKYPWGQMAKIGDSFFIACDQPKARMLQSSLYSTCRRYRLAIRQVTENGIEGLRVWRTE